MGNSYVITPLLSADHRRALEHLLFFNVNQHRVLTGIQESIQNYGVPEILEEKGYLRITVGDLRDVRTLFAASPQGWPLGFVVFAQLARSRFVVLHLGIEPRLRSRLDVNTPVLLELLREVRSTARSMQGVERIEMVYNPRHVVRLAREMSQPH